jgi:hypothetical protein
MRPRAVWPASGPGNRWMRSHTQVGSKRSGSGPSLVRDLLWILDIPAFPQPLVFLLLMEGVQEVCHHNHHSTRWSHTCMSSSRDMRSASVTFWPPRKALSSRNMSSSCHRNQSIRSSCIPPGSQWLLLPPDGGRGWVQSVPSPLSRSLRVKPFPRWLD